MKSLFCGAFLLLSVTSGLTSVVSKYYTDFKSGLTWNDAQSYCRRYHTDLATIYRQSDLNSLDLKEYFAWVGLERDLSNPWFDKIWADGKVNTLNDWLQNHTDFSPSCAALNYYYSRFFNPYCQAYYFFICEKYSQQTFYLETKKWSDAQDYCGSVSGTLANLKFNYLNLNNLEQDFPIWIGLHRDGGSWNWSTGFSDYRAWDQSEPRNDDCVAISSVTQKMSTKNCDIRFPFICMGDNVFLVKENKSWEEALELCRGFTPSTGSGLRFDLLSLEPGEEHEYVRSKAMEANTEEVWTGLRFLAGDWLWVNGAGVLYSDLPLCPILGQHCGALSKKNSNSMEARDCLERKNVLCYSYYA